MDKKYDVYDSSIRNGILCFGSGSYTADKEKDISEDKIYLVFRLISIF